MFIVLAFTLLAVCFDYIDLYIMTLAREPKQWSWGGLWGVPGGWGGLGVAMGQSGQQIKSAF